LAVAAFDLPGPDRPSSSLELIVRNAVLEPLEIANEVGDQTGRHRLSGLFRWNERAPFKDDAQQVTTSDGRIPDVDDHFDRVRNGTEVLDDLLEVLAQMKSVENEVRVRKASFRRLHESVAAISKEDKFRIGVPAARARSALKDFEEAIEGFLRAHEAPGDVPVTSGLGEPYVDLAHEANS